MTVGLKWACVPLILLTACSGPPPPSVPSPIPTPAPVKVGVLTYVEGDVSVQTGGQWAPVDVGDKVSEASTVKTAKNSACDLQFGQLGIVHIAENTVVSLKTVGLSDTKKAVDLQLIAGVVTAKVSKLLQEQRFQVRTNTVVCGVRGTRFLVTQRENENTRIAVAEGSVALVPATFDPGVMEGLAKDPAQAAKVQAVLESILVSAPLVTVGQEVEVTPVDMKKAAEAVTQVQRALAAEVAASPSAQPSDASLSPQMPLSESMRQVLESYQKAAPAESASKITVISGAAQKSLDETADLKILETMPEKGAATPTPSPAAATPGAVAPLKAPKLIAPAPGAKVDVVVKASITFQWKMSEGASRYSVTLLAPDKSVVKTWETAELSVVLDRFDKLQPGTFTWLVVALREKDGETEKGPASQSSFQLLKKGQLSAPVLDLGDSQ